MGWLANIFRPPSDEELIEKLAQNAYEYGLSLTEWGADGPRIRFCNTLEKIRSRLQEDYAAHPALHIIGERLSKINVQYLDNYLTLEHAIEDILQPIIDRKYPHPFQNLGPKAQEP